MPKQVSISFSGGGRSGYQNFFGTGYQKIGTGYQNLVPGTKISWYRVPKYLEKISKKKFFLSKIAFSANSDLSSVKVGPRTQRRFPWKNCTRKMTKAERGTREVFGIFRVLRPDKMYKLIIFSDKFIGLWLILLNDHKIIKYWPTSMLSEKYLFDTHF